MHVVLSTAPPESAPLLASKLIDERVAACVNLVPGVTSIYRWKGEVQCDGETLLVIKTSAAALPRLMERLPELHPYEVPEIVVLDSSAAHPAYEAWADGETQG